MFVLGVANLLDMILAMTESMTKYDVAVVGAGAAGLMAAVWCGRLGLKVLLLDGREKFGAKILISGGTRCNITNRQVSEKDFKSNSPRVVRNILAALPPVKAVAFFNEIGIEVVEEAGGKYFPSTHSGKTVLESFVREIEKLQVDLKVPVKVAGIAKENGYFKISGNGQNFYAKTAVLTTGGLSFPATGSDGSGYEIARSFGHSLVETSPSLTPLETNDRDFKKITGISLPVKLIFQSPEETASYEGSFLFTHFGFSGPVVLDISRHWIRAADKARARIFVNFFPGHSDEELRELFIEEAQYGQESKFLGKFLSQALPARFVSLFLYKLNIDPQIPLNDLRREEREKVIQTLLHFPLPVSGSLGYAKAEVTAGGVDLAEVDPKTLESKKADGLFFAGEILDVDGRIGGFNFQWAWASGYAAACAVKKKIG